MKMKARVEKGFLFTLPKVETKIRLHRMSPLDNLSIPGWSGGGDSCAQPNHTATCVTVSGGC